MKINTIQEKIHALNKEIRELQKQAISIDRTLRSRIERKKALEDKLAVIKDQGIHITDHAIVRYIERCMNVDVDKIKTEMLDSEMTSLINKLASGSFPHKKGYKLKVIDKKIITVLTK